MPTTSPQHIKFFSPVTFIAAAAAGEGDTPALRKFTMTAYTGGILALYDSIVVDLSGMRISSKARPILRDHDASRIVGHTDSIDVRSGKIEVSGVISGAGPDADEVVESSLRGFPWQASIGASIQQMESIVAGQSVSVNGRTFKGPLLVARKTVLKEVSFVSLGADDQTSAKVTAKKPGANMGVEIEHDDNDRQPPTPSTLPPELKAEYRKFVAAEAERIGFIKEICDGKHLDIECQAIEEGWDTDRVSTAVLRASRSKPAGPAIHSKSSAVDGQVLEASLCMSAGLSEEKAGKHFDQRVMNAAVSRDHRGARLHSLLYAVAAAAGVYVRPGAGGDEMIQAAFRANDMLQASSGFSTISLSGILGNVAGKMLLDAYQAAASVVRQFCAETDLSDFKSHTRYRMTMAGQFLKVGPDGELKSANLSEEGYSNQIETYGRIITLTRQMMTNDDLGAFLQIPKAMGRHAALALEEAVFALLLSNPSSFFGAGHANYQEGAGTALDIDALTVAEQSFLDRKDSDGKFILIEPKIMLVPTALKVTAQLLFNEKQINQDPADNKAKPAANPHVSRFMPVASPYLGLSSLTGYSQKAWYLFADPNDVAAMEIGYLRGQRSPTIQGGETDFDVLGMRWRGFFDFGVAMGDYRGALKMKGEA